MGELKRLVREIHRRSLWQVLGVYLAGSWIALQVVEQLAEAASLPGWVRPFALVLLVIGLPVVLATAFVQEGLGSAREMPRTSTTTDPDSSADAARGSSREAARTPRVFTWRNAFAGGVIAAAAWGIVATGLLLSGERRASRSEDGFAEDRAPRVVAVLPLENLSADDANRFFADGVHEEILSSLSQIDALRVISRTSVVRYEDSDLTLPEIGRELGASAVLEGSVRRADQRVRVTAQLIDVETDQHLWSRTFDGDLSDIFAIQTEIAQEIAVALAAELTEQEESEIHARPTENFAAYDAYLEGLSRQRRRLVRENAVEAAEAFRRAVELDPEFAEAWAALAQAEVWLEWDFGEPDAYASAVAALERARSLAPDAFETLMAEGQVHYYGDRDFERALQSFFAAERLAPNRAEVIEHIGHVRRRQGRWDDALARWRQALELDPYSDLSFTIGQGHFWLREFDEADRFLDLALASAPGLASAYALKFLNRVRAGDVAGAGEVVEEAEDALGAADALRAWTALLEGDYELATRIDPPGVSALMGLQPGLMAAALLGEEVRRRAADSIRAEVEGVRDSLPYSRFGPMRAEVLALRDDAMLGLADALTGNFAAARERLDGALRSYGFDRDAQTGYRPAFAAAVTETLAGDVERAVEHLEAVLENPSPISVGLLETMPIFDVLRDEPPFQELLERYRGPRQPS